MRLFFAGIRKLYRRTATVVAIILTVGLVAGLYALLGVSAQQVAAQQPEQSAAVLRMLRFPEAYNGILGLIIGLGGLVVVIFGAAIAGTEWNWGTLKTAIARGESRYRYIVMTFVAVALVVIVAVLASFVAGIGGALLGGTIAGVGSGGMDDAAALRALPEKIVRVSICMIEFAALGYSIATIARSQMAGVGVAVGTYFASSFGELALPDVLRWFPFNAANFAAGLGTSSGTTTTVNTHALDPNVALAAVLAWLVGSIVVAAIFTERAEISG